MSTGQFRVLFASDGSPAANAAVKVGSGFPWPSGALGFGVVARDVPSDPEHSTLLEALEQASENVSRRLMRALRRRWPDATVNVVPAPPVSGVLAEAGRMNAGAVVVGWRGHGAFRRLLAGSVSRGVVRGSSCPVLVVRREHAAIHRIVVGVDGSDSSRRAIDFVARLEAPSGGRVMLLTALEPMYVPSQRFLPTITAEVAAEITRLDSEKAAEARRSLDQAARRLETAGWGVSSAVVMGAPLWALLAAVKSEHAGLLVVGARGKSAVERLLLGSVAEGALNRSPVPVLVVR